MRRAANGEDGEDAPVANAEVDEIALEARQVVEVAAVGAGDDVPINVRRLRQAADGGRGCAEAVAVATHPVVIVLKAVQADGGRPHAGSQQPRQPLGEKQSVGDDAPGKFAAVKLAATGLNVRAHKRLATGEDDEHLVRVDVRPDLVHHAEEVGHRHVGHEGRDATIAAAVPAGHVAAQRALPEERAELVQLDAVAVQAAEGLEREPFLEVDLDVVHLFLRLSVTLTSFSAAPKNQLRSPPFRSSLAKPTVTLSES